MLLNIYIYLVNIYMIEDYYVYIFSSVFATVGFLARYLWEFIMARRKREFTEKITSI